MTSAPLTTWLFVILDYLVSTMSQSDNPVNQNAQIDMDTSITQTLLTSFMNHII